MYSDHVCFAVALTFYPTKNLASILTYFLSDIAVPTEIRHSQLRPEAAEGGGGENNSEKI